MQGFLNEKYNGYLEHFHCSSRKLQMLDHHFEILGMLKSCLRMVKTPERRIVKFKPISRTLGRNYGFIMKHNNFFAKAVHMDI